MAQDRAKVAELFGEPCNANTDKETALYQSKGSRKGSSTVLKKACEPGDYRMRCFGVLYLRNEGFAGRAEAIKLLAGACEKIRAVCYNPPAAICAKNISASEKRGRRKSELLYHEALRGKSMHAR